MAVKIPTSLGSPVIPQAGRASRVATLDNGIADDFVQGSRLYGEAWHRTAAGLQEVGKAFDYLQDQSNKKETKDLLNQFITDKTNLLYGDGGYMLMQGDDAVKNAKGVGEKLDKLRQDYLGKTSNKQVNTMFDLSSAELLAPDKEDILQHAGKQSIVAMDTTDAATIDTATNLLAANPTNPKAVTQATTLIMGSTLSILDRKGITNQTARDEAVFDAVSKARAAAVRVALGRDVEAGKALYAQWKDNIQGTDQAALEGDITQAVKVQQQEKEHAFWNSVRMQELANDQANDKLFDMYSRGELTPEAVQKMPGLKGQAKALWAKTLTDDIKEKAKEQLKNDQINSFNDLSSRIRTDPKSVSDAQIYMSPLDEGSKNTLLKDKDARLKGLVTPEQDAADAELMNDLTVRPETVTLDRIAAAPLSPERKNFYREEVLKRQKEAAKAQEPKTNWNVYNDTLKRVIAGTIGYDEILEGVGPNSYTLDQAKEFNSILKDKNNPGMEQKKAMMDKMMDAAKSRLDMTMPGMKDKKGAEYTGRFYSFMLHSLEEGERKGERWQDLLDMNSPKSIWKDVPTFERDMQQVMGDIFAPYRELDNEGGSSDTGEISYPDAASVTKDYKAGKITREKAKDILIKNGWAQ